ncbi:methyl-accepting chemotaxis protein [Shimia sp. MMG029]|uniref:methyl-accepting chemotaxis protein n=1 Tax=Shimia sp. MMG029 TaxID=3021978 RepID=UPI0022FE9EED|nr:HAMP domain-containing methyl-accepting chemotaxis protein [Shimia sp. MMG029]MDA5556502.1 HAMP domain-containing methyl-accepting chemotaxis protein [Shimia sp. MMG029]
MKPKITITAAIISIIVLALGVMGGLGATSYYSHIMRDKMQSDLEDIEELNIATANLQVEFLMARRSEKDLLLREAEKYIDRHAQTMVSLKSEFEMIEQIVPEIPEMAEFATLVPLLGTAVSAYEQSFLEMVSLKQKLGLSEKEGIRKTLADAIAAVEAEVAGVSIPILHAKLLTIQLHAKQFRLEPDAAELATIKQLIQEFKGFPEFFYDDPAVIPDLHEKLDIYLTSFTEYVNTRLMESEKRLEMSARFSDAEPVMAQFKAAAHNELTKKLAESERISALAQQVTQLAGIIGSIVFVLFAVFLARAISRPLKKTDAVLKKMMEGDFTAEPPRSFIREIGAIANAVTNFQDEERIKHDITQQMSRVIDACAEGDFSDRIDIGDATGTFAELGRGVNAIGEVAENGLGDVKEALEILSTGDLTHEMPQGQKGVFKDISETLTHLTSSLDGMVRQLSSSSNVLNRTSKEISHSVDDASRRGEISAASLEETSSSLQTVAETVNSTAQSAQEARSHVNNAQKKAEATRSVADQTVEAIQRIKESSDAISQISGLIEDVAFQTNLLALNAGVEAARAGDAGRGFAVVASEVRALAQRSSEAAHEINTLISSSQTEVVNGVNLMDDTGKSLGEILQAVEQVVGKVNEIAENAVDQSTGLAEVNAAVENLDRDSQKSAAMLEETAASGQVLLGEAENLVRAVSGFKLKTEAETLADEDTLDAEWDAA